MLYDWSVWHARTEGFKELKEKGVEFKSDIEFKNALKEHLGEVDARNHSSVLIQNAVDINAILILIGILSFIAAFHFSVGPVMWVLFSELFPNRLRGLAISFVGLINSGVSFLVQLLFILSFSLIVFKSYWLVLAHY